MGSEHLNNTKQSFIIALETSSDITFGSLAHSTNRTEQLSILLSDTKTDTEYNFRHRSLADLGGGVPGARLPLWDPILPFLHTFSPKSTCVGGPRPVHAPPPTGNPGSATAGSRLFAVIIQDASF